MVELLLPLRHAAEQVVVARVDQWALGLRVATVLEISTIIPGAVAVARTTALPDLREKRKSGEKRKTDVPGQHFTWGMYSSIMKLACYRQYKMPDRSRKNRQ